MGLALHDRAPTVSVVGHDRPDVLERAAAREAIDAKAADPQTAVAAADLVVLATPPAVTLRLLDTIADALPPDAVVTDVASIKEPVMDQARDVLPAGVSFVGGHPMAGAEHAGIDHADALLFENATYVLCPAATASEAALDTVRWLTETVGARPLRMEAARHDRIAAAVSHLPQLLAVALTNTAAAHDDGAMHLAAGGFRDMTRIAASPFELWRDILVGNQGYVLDALSRFSNQLQRLRSRLAADLMDDIEAAFGQARAARASIPEGMKGFLTPQHDLYVQAPDTPGTLHRLTGALSSADLNIKDIELLKVREGAAGTFRLGFASAADAQAARTVLEDAGFSARRP